MKILFISSDIRGKFGGAVFSRTILRALQSLPNYAVDTFFIHPPNTIKEKILFALQGYYHGGKNDYSLLHSIIEERKVDVVFINSTSFGGITYRIHKDFPYVKIVSMAHNVEFIFYANTCILKKWRAFFNLCKLFFVYFGERKQLRSSDILLCLNQRDSDLFERYYQRRPDKQIPLVLEDQYEKVGRDPGLSTEVDNYGIFVGSRNHPNEFAARFLAAKIAPFLPIPVKIVGSGFEQIKKDLEQYPNMEVVGTVENLSEYYGHAAFVISPIYHGSGMKTKTAEALMFGKYIFGTTEAFVGYNLPLPECGLLCETAEDFILGIKDFLHHPLPKFNPRSREIYLQNYSFAVLQNLLKQTLHSLSTGEQQ